MDCPGIQGRMKKQNNKKRCKTSQDSWGKWSRSGFLDELDQQEVLHVAAGHMDMFLQCSGRSTVEKPM